MEHGVKQITTWGISMPGKDERIVISHIDDVRALLKTWAEWQRTGTGQNIGYPKSSAFIHADEGRETCTANNSNDVAEKVERAMCILKSISPMLFQCLLCEYLYELTIREAAERLKCGEKTYRLRRQEAEYFIAGKFA